jgi:hypothetical protein
VRRYLPAPSRKKCFLPFHLIFPLCSAVLWLGATSQRYHAAFLPAN